MRRMLQPYSRHVEAVFEPVIVPQLSPEQHRRLAVATAQLYAAGEGLVAEANSELQAAQSTHSATGRSLRRRGGDTQEGCTIKSWSPPCSTLQAEQSAHNRPLCTSRPLSWHHLQHMLPGRLSLWP